jgi:prevent-host-death family protein
MTTMLSKSQFKPRALEYFRRVERTGQEIIITDHGRPVARIVPYEVDQEQALRSLRGTVLEYHDPTEPVGLRDWETLEDP